MVDLSIFEKIKFLVMLRTSIFTSIGILKFSIGFMSLQMNTCIMQCMKKIAVFLYGFLEFHQQNHVPEIEKLDLCQFFLQLLDFSSSSFQRSLLQCSLSFVVLCVSLHVSYVLLLLIYFPIVIELISKFNMKTLLQGVQCD